MTVYELIDHMVEDMKQLCVKGPENMQIILQTLNNLAVLKNCLQESEKAAKEQTETEHE